MRYAVLFPGQGSQFVGMGSDVFAARPDLLGRSADAVLGWSLQEVCEEGPEEELVRTDRAQPALYAVSYALWEAFIKAIDRPPIAAAGHSLGEYTALAAAGAVDYSEGLRLVAARGRAMAEATRNSQGAMAAVMGADVETVEKAVASLRSEDAAVWVANVNAPGQIVVAGTTEAIDTLAAVPRDHGLRRVIRLNVSGAFHTPLMEPARVTLESALSSIKFESPAFAVWANLTASPIVDPAESLGGQLVGRVRFADSLAAMYHAGTEAFVHIGPSDVTAGMAKRTVEDAEVITVSSLDDIGAAVARLAVT